MYCLRVSCNWQCCSRCSAVIMSAMQGHISDSSTLNLLYMWALSLLCPVLMCVQSMEAVWLVEVWVLLLPSLHDEGFDDGLFNCPLGPTVLLPELACLLVHFIWSCSVLVSTAGLGLSGLWGRPGQFSPGWDPSGWDSRACWGQREHLWRWLHWVWFGVGCLCSQLWLFWELQLLF